MKEKKGGECVMYNAAIACFTTYLGEEGLLKGAAHDLGAHVGVLEVRHTGDAPVRLRAEERRKREDLTFLG